MANLVDTPETLHPAYNLIHFLYTSATPEQVTEVLTALYPNDNKQVSIVRDFITGENRVDVHGIVTGLFRDICEAITTTGIIGWAYDDYRLKVIYEIDGQTYAALNAVYQLGEDYTGLNETGVPFLSTEEFDSEKTMRIKAYEGYPVGTSVIYQTGFEFDLSGTFRFTINIPTNNYNNAVSFLATADIPSMLHSGTVIIDWGDGQISYDIDEIHNYPAPGVYEVQVKANSLSFDPEYVGTTATSSKPWYSIRAITREILDWGENEWGNVNFSGMAQLTSVPSPLPLQSDNSLASLFRNTNITTAPPVTFFSNYEGTAVIQNIDYMFGGSTTSDAAKFTHSNWYSLLSPLRLGVTSMQYLFARNQRIVDTVPGLYTLFAAAHRNPSSTSTARYYTYEDSSVQNVLSGTFTGYVLPTDPITSVTNLAYYAFSGCQRLVSVAADAFDVLPSGFNGTIALISTFIDCRVLPSVPSTILQPLAPYLTALTQCFWVYQYGTTAPTQMGAFAIPAGLLDNCTRLTNAYLAFAANATTEIPTDFFKDCTALTTIGSMFESNRNLTRINDYPINPTSFNRAFAYCGLSGAGIQLTDGHFSRLVRPTNISEMFVGSRFNITAQHVDWFTGVTTITNASQAFSLATLSNSSQQVLMPTRLLGDSPNISNMNQCFRPSGGASSGLQIWIGESPVDANGNKFWQRPNVPSNYSLCFYQQTALSDYADIPTGWKD